MISSSLWFELLAYWGTRCLGWRWLSWEKCVSRAKDGWSVVAEAAFRGTTVSPLSLVHLPPPLAECVVGRLWSGVRAGRNFLKKHLCICSASAGRV